MKSFEERGLLEILRHKSFEGRVLEILRQESKDLSMPKEFRAGARNCLKALENLKRVYPDVYREVMRTPTLDDPDPRARKRLRLLHNLREVK
jgi:hypothetical protein